MINGFIRVAAATPSIKVADCKHNSEKIIELIKQAAVEKAAIAVFPELCVTAYTCGDLFNQRILIKEAYNSLLKIAEETAGLDIVSVVGAPLQAGNGLVNCAVVISSGKILGVVPKAYLQSGNGYSEERFFTSSLNVNEDYINIGGEAVPFGTDLIFCSDKIPEFKFAVETGGDLWVPKSPSADYVLAGAVIICSPSASSEIIGMSDYRKNIINAQSGKLLCTYVYSDAGEGESTTDLVFSGHNMISEKGRLLVESEKYKPGIIYADTDIFLLADERQKVKSFNLADAPFMRKIFFTHEIVKYQSLLRKIKQKPFVPEDEAERRSRCEEVLNIQAEGLKKRLKHTGITRAVLGLSGGLDSTLALIVVVRAFDKLNLSRKGILTVTMPCFGTTRRTYNNALALAENLQTEFMEINITDAVVQHFKDIGQDINNHDVTYENSQARERYQVLMDLANKVNGLVIGSGDLSELALGFATYNGDHMSMYAVNVSVPKTLVRPLVAHEAQIYGGKLKKVLEDILDTPVSPELIPPKEGEIVQKTEDIVGPYELHDFYLYYAVRYGFEPEKILRLATMAFAGKYSKDVIEKWLKIFYRRFFSQQFKRSCLPDGPKTGTVSLSPRGGFVMPSDASGKTWLE